MPPGSRSAAFFMSHRIVALPALSYVAGTKSGHFPPQHPQNGGFDENTRQNTTAQLKHPGLHQIASSIMHY
jgi:hypothetical protein